MKPVNTPGFNFQNEMSVLVRSNSPTALYNMLMDEARRGRKVEEKEPAQELIGADASRLINTVIETSITLRHA
jgi:hypothetical protein